MKRVNYEQYRIKRSSSQPLQGLPKNLTRKHEKIKLTQRYRILSCHDPNTGRHYSLNEMLERRILNKHTSSFCLPSTGQVWPIDEAIQMGFILAELISESFESSNDLQKSIQNVDRYVKIRYPLVGNKSQVNYQASDL